ncbi:MAG: hypothetical protein ACE5HX_06910, partial [bacterium]
NSAPPLGDGQTDFDMRLLLGRSIWHYRGYINMDLGLRARSGEPVNEIPYSLELGIDLTRDYLLIGQISGVRSISENQNQTDFRIVNGMVQNFVGTGAVEDYLKAHLQLIYRLNSKMEISFMFEQLLRGRNTSHATILGGGLILHN